MAGPFVLRPQIGRMELLLILLGSAMVLVIATMTTRGSQMTYGEGAWRYFYIVYYDEFYLYGRMEPFTSAWESGDWREKTRAVIWGPVKWLMDLLLLMNVTLPLWIWLRPSWRSWLWDIMGWYGFMKLLLMMLVFLLRGFWDWYARDTGVVYTWMLGLYLLYFVGATRYGRLARLVFGAWGRR
ncbi:MAG: hypothetical protein AAGK14_05335 [Verrucomicrobiota bacterium]